MRTDAAELSQLQAELEAQAARAEQLQIQAQDAEALARLNDKEREAVARAVRADIAGESKRASRTQWIANVLFFIAGVGASIAVTLFVRPL